MGDGSRNVRELIDPELPLRRRGALALADRPLAERPIKGLCGACVDWVRWTMRFVWTFSTFVGVGDRFRSAAAAAAAERLLVDV